MEEPITGREPYPETLGRLLVEITARLRHRVGPVFGANGVKPRHLDLLRLLARREHAGEQTTQQQLAEAMRIDPSVLVSLLNELERDGAVQRIRDTKDRRRHLVVVSPSGLTLLDGINADIEQAERAVFGVLTEEERETLRLLLDSIRDGMDAGAGDCGHQDS